MMPDSLYTATSSQCPNQAQWLRYRRNQASPLETQAIENHFTDCPLCSIAVETIMSTSPDDLESQWRSLHQKNTTLPNEYQAQSKVVFKRFLMPIAAAATLIGLVWGAMSLFREAKQEQPLPITQNTSPSTEQTSIDSLRNETKMAKETIAQDAPPLPAEPQPGTPPSIKKNIDNTVGLSNKPSLAIERQADKSIQLEPVQNDNLTALSQADAAPTEEKLLETSSAGQASPPVEMPSVAVSKKEAISAVSKQKTRAAAAFNTVEPGIIAYQEGRYADAIPFLEQQAQTGNYRQQSAIYLADAYQKTGNRQAARKLLKKIIGRNGPNAKQAQQMLDLLEKE